MFVGYLVKQIDHAKAQFSRPDFVRRVLDPDFVPQERYAELLVSDIPPRARLDVFLDLYRENENWKPEHMRVFLKVLFGNLGDDEIRQACEVITEDFKTSDTESAVGVMLGSFPPALWPRIGEAARLRVENKIIRSVRDGRYESSSGKCLSGALGTWATNIFSVLTLKDEMIGAVASKLWSSAATERAYVFRYLFHSLQTLSETVPPHIASALSSRLKAGDKYVHMALGIDPPWGESVWPEELKKAYASFNDAEPTNGFEDDNIPF
jgi:hypothetical protein